MVLVAGDAAYDIKQVETVKTATGSVDEVESQDGLLVPGKDGKTKMSFDGLDLMEQVAEMQKSMDPLISTLAGLYIY